MKKLLSALFIAVTAGSYAYAQAPANTEYPKYTIKQIQERSQEDLRNCVDASTFFGTGGTTRQTVKVGGIVTMPGDQAVTARSRDNERRQVWIRSGSGPWSGLGIIVAGNDSKVSNLLSVVDNLMPGDSVIVTGLVDEFNGESQILVIENGIEVVGHFPAKASIEPKLLSVGELNNENSINNLTTGEQWEGTFVEIRNVTVVNVSTFSSTTAVYGTNRVTFDVIDGEGNRIRISDRFIAGRTRENHPQGTLNVPVVGDFYKSIKGIVIHNINGCRGTASANGYSIDPFQENHYEKGEVPIISNLRRDKAYSNLTTGMVVTATITHRSLEITNASLHYAVGVNNNTYTAVPMTKGAENVYSATIPAQAEGSFVKYYVSARDAVGATATIPNVPAGIPAQFYVVREGLLTVSDVQYTPYTNGTSGFVGFPVTVEGIVTSTVNDLGQVFIQQEGATSWGAIYGVGNEALNTLALGDRVRITGTVQDGPSTAGNFNFTRLVEVSAVSKLASGITTITPLVISPTALSAADAEKYESMLVRIQAPENGHLYVVHTNPNATGTSNFGDYRVNSDNSKTNEGTIVLAGRRDANVTSSLSVPYVNDARWATTDGEMTVEPIVMTKGSTIQSLTGIVHYSFNFFKIFPRTASDFTGVNVVLSLTASKDNQYSVYPNPSNGVFNLQGFEAGKGLTAIVWDLSGRRVLAESINSNDQPVNVSSLKGGMYVLTVQDAKGGIVYRNKVSVIK